MRSPFAGRLDSRLAFVVVGALLVAVNGGLLFENRGLRAEIARLTQTRGLEVRPGTRLTALRGSDFAGAAVTVSYAGQARRTLLLVFSPACRSCTENWPRWKDLIGRARDTARVVGVDLTTLATAQYMREHGAGDIQVVSDVDASSIVSHNLRLTPQTIVVDENGVVLRVWTGVLQEDDLAEALSIVSPGNAAAPSPH